MLRQFDVCYIGWHNNKLYSYGISANKIFDYMYSAKPIIHAININDDVIQREKCGISIFPEDSQAITQAILELQNMDSSALEEMGKNAKKYVLKYHTYNSLAKKYKELL
jgi:glycosyltransferase involved in cell wall biosynthesis